MSKSLGKSCRQIPQYKAFMNDRTGIEIETELSALLKNAGVLAPLSAPIAEYGARLLEANRRFNVTGAKSAEQLLPHLLDSLTVAPYVESPLVDVGSGGGLPAIPLAIATGVEVTLVETTTKKARFLEELLDTFGLQGRVIAERAEVAAHDPGLREIFASATARAVSAAPTVAELTLPFLAIGGVAVLQRGTLDDRERRATEDAALMLGGRLEREITLAGERRILLLRKTATTQGRFPRRVGIPEKRPLCL
jgi:16S rRNA (guanine527-N7)-methyltransferase